MSNYPQFTCIMLVTIVFIVIRRDWRYARGELRNSVHIESICLLYNVTTHLSATRTDARELETALVAELAGQLAA